MAKTRFIGGSHHGKFENFPETTRSDLRWRVPAPHYHSAAAYYGAASFYNSRASIEEYELRPVSFGPYTKLWVMAKVGMTEAELMRRVTDIVEGV